MVFSGILWFIMVYYAILWYTMVKYFILWFSMSDEPEVGKASRGEGFKIRSRAGLLEALESNLP